MANKHKNVEVFIKGTDYASPAFEKVQRNAKRMDNMFKQASRSTDKFHIAMRSASVAANKLDQKFASIAKKTAKLGFTTATVATTAFVGASINEFRKLSNGLSKVNTLYDQTAKSQAKMTKDSIRMMRLLPTGIENITQGTYDVISGGIDPSKATQATRKFGMGAVAGITDISTVAKAAQGTMNAFGKEVKDLDTILDLQFMTVKSGIVEYQELASALGTGVLASANSAGQNMETLYASIAQLTKNAIPANIATTSLIQLFNKLTDTKAIKELKEFGVEVRDAENNTRPLIEIIKDLDEQFRKRGFTDSQKAGILKEFLGSDEAVRAMNPLLNKVGEFEKSIKDFSNSDGVMMEAFEDRLYDINTQFDLMINNIKANGMEYTLGFKPMIDEMTEPLIENQKIEFEIMNLEDELAEITDEKRKIQIEARITDLKLQQDAIKHMPGAVEAINVKITELESQKKGAGEEEQKKIDKELVTWRLRLAQAEETAFERFSKALDESVENLNKLNPQFATFTETIGEFLLSFVGEEGETNRKIARDVGLTLGGLYVAKKIGDAYKWFKDFGNIISTNTGSASNTATTLKNSSRVISQASRGSRIINAAQSLGKVVTTTDPVSMPYTAMTLGNWNDYQIKEQLNKKGKANFLNSLFANNFLGFRIFTGAKSYEELEAKYLIAKDREGLYSRVKTGSYDKKDVKLLRKSKQFSDPYSLNMFNDKELVSGFISHYERFYGKKENPLNLKRGPITEQYADKLLNKGSNSAIAKLAEEINRTPQINIQPPIVNVSPPNVNVNVDVDRGGLITQTVTYEDMSRKAEIESRRYGKSK